MAYPALTSSAVAARSRKYLAATGKAAFVWSVLALSLAGCVTTENWISARKASSTAPKGTTVSEVSMIWKGLAVTQDSLNGGRPLPGIAGRMYLIGPDLGTPLLCDGKAIIDMYHPNDKGKLQLLERWEIDSVTLQRLARQDVIGHGYTLFLPWSTYSTSIVQAQMRVTFVPAQAANPVYGPPTMVNIRPAAPIPIQEQNVVAPNLKTP